MRHLLLLKEVDTHGANKYSFGLPKCKRQATVSYDQISQSRSRESQTGILDNATNTVTEYINPITF